MTIRLVMEQTLKRVREFEVNHKMEDAKLLCCYLEDCSEKAFAELVSRHVNLVYFAALRRVGGDRHLAEEVTQRVFADLAHKAASLKSRSVLAGWLYTSTRFAAAQAVRTERRRRTYEQEAQTMNELHAVAEPGWDQLRPIIDEVMDELNEHDREAVLLRFFENRSLAEIGAKFSLSPDAARMRIDRALDKLRGLLAKRGIASTAVVLAEIFASQLGAAAPIGLVARIVDAVPGPAGTITAVTFGLWKILTILAIGAVAGGLIVYVADRMHPPAAAFGAVSQICGTGQNPIKPANSGDSSSQAAGNSSLGQQRLPSDKIKSVMTRNEILEQMNADPQYRASLVALARSLLDFIYGPLFKNLNLSADRLERFKDLLIEKESIYNDIYDTLAYEPVHDTEYRTLFDQLDGELSKDVNDKIEAFLTSPEYAQFVDYSEDLPQWTKVNEATRILQSTATPLTDEQAKQLVVLLRKGRPQSTHIWNTDIPRGSGVLPLQAQITALVLKQAGGILSPEQIKVLSQNQ
jgi:RNA polymerase sigma factor (sigma-70 family)